MIIDDPAPTLNECAYIPSSAFKEFIDNCLVKSPLHRYTIHHALNHSFLKKASGPGLLKTYLSRRPNLDRSTFIRAQKPRAPRVRGMNWRLWKQHGTLIGPA
jgi:serine/threonine protein kinase